MSDFYNPDGGAGYRYDDPAFAHSLAASGYGYLSARSKLACLFPMTTRLEFMRALIARLYPICRSITGDGVRESLSILREHLPLEIHEVPTGTQVLDWTIPKEWNIRDAWIKNSAGERLVDFTKLNLHVVSYSVPIHQMMRLAELKDAPLHGPGSSYLGSLSDFLLQGVLGLLPE